MNILFLYTELADYTIACLKALKESRNDVNIVVIHFPINPEAPFKFNFSGIGNFYCVKDFPDIKSLLIKVKEVDPDKIIVSGWKVPFYMKVCKEYKKKAVIVLTMDNHFTGSLKQNIFRLIFPFTFLQTFDYCWVPGIPQKQYAIKLGFPESRVKEDFYCCDLLKFNSYYLKFKESRDQSFPKVFLCVARYIPQKNYEMLWKAFIKWQNQQPNEWQLWCAGTGENFNQRMEHPSIRHLGFIQGSEWERVIKNSGVFVLPSLFEPWGVVVHEFSASGFPIFLSNRVGSSTKFLSTENGISFNPISEAEIINGFEFFRNCSSEKLNEMGAYSNHLAYSVTPQSWASAVLDEFV